jgi:Zn-dependent peptidase ImmA (M78 family)
VEVALRLGDSDGVRMYAGLPGESDWDGECYRCVTRVSDRARQPVVRRADITEQLIGLFADYFRDRRRLLALSERLQTNDPSVVAIEVRRALGLSADQPVDNVVACLESLGIPVAEMPVVGRNISAFSCWSGDQPLALVRTSGVTRGRQRFDAAHELGHLLLHRNGKPPGHRIAESEANRFAGSFLLPPRPVAAAFQRGVNWDRLRDSARAYGVSMEAMLYRAYELDSIGPVTREAAAKYLRLFRGAAVRDLDALKPERPSLLPRLVDEGSCNHERLVTALSREALGRPPKRQNRKVAA